MKRGGIGITLAILAGLVPAGAHAQSGERPWSGSVTPYLWAPSIDGTLRYNATSGGGRPNVDLSASDFLQKVEGVFMIAGEARHGRLSLFSDLMYLDLKGENSTLRSVDFGSGNLPIDASLNTNVQTKVKAFAWSALAGYSVSHSPESTLDVFGGARYLSVKAESSWQLGAVIQGPGAGQAFDRAGSVSDRENLWDAVVGIRGRFRLGDGHWVIPYYADVGAGSSRLTWQAALGVSYLFGWGDVGLAYRYLSYEQSGDKLVHDLTLDGPMLGATFHF